MYIKIKINTKNRTQKMTELDTTSDLLKKRFEFTEQMIRMQQITRNSCGRYILGLNHCISAEEKMQLIMQNNTSEEAVTEAEDIISRHDDPFIYIPVSFPIEVVMSIVDNYNFTIYLVRNNNNLMLIPI